MDKIVENRERKLGSEKKHRSEAMKKDITRLFCLVDDFLKELEEERKKKKIEDVKKPRKPTRTPGLTESEITTIILMFQESPCRNFKYFYKSYLQQYRPEFPKMPRILYFLTLLFCCTLRKRSKIAYYEGLFVCRQRVYQQGFVSPFDGSRLRIITGIKCSMKNILMSFEEKILLRKCSLVESVFDYLKNKFMFVHIISTLTAYQLKPSKTSVSCHSFLLANP